MEVEIITSSREIYKSQAVKEINLPGETGRLGVLPEHVGLITPLKIGIINIKEDNGDKKDFFISGGILEVHQDKVIVLAEEADMAENVIADEINKAIEKAQEQLHSDIPSAELVKIEKELRYQRFKLSHLEF